MSAVYDLTLVSLLHAGRRDHLHTTKGALERPTVAIINELKKLTSIKDVVK